MKINVVKTKALVKNIKREHPDLATHFSEHALTEITKKELIRSSRSTSIIALTERCAGSMDNQLQSTAEDQKKLLQDCLEGDCEYPLEVIAEMTPRQKINNYLIWNGIQGFTDDILDAISAAYGIILEPDLNR